MCAAAWIIHRRNKAIRIFQFIPAQLQKAVVIFPRHPYINIVIPGNKAFVAYRTQKSPADGIIPELIFFTNRLEFFKQFQLYRPDFFHRFIDKISVPIFTLQKAVRKLHGFPFILLSVIRSKYRKTVFLSFPNSKFQDMHLHWHRTS